MRNDGALHKSNLWVRHTNVQSLFQMIAIDGPDRVLYGCCNAATLPDTMELYQLRGFAAVAAEGHVTRASEKLHVSQPALSAQIRALEDELQVALFDRLPSGMSLTPAGRRLLGKALDVLAAAHALEREAGSLRGDVAGRVRLACVSDPEFLRLPEILADALATCPSIEIELLHEVTGLAFARVRDGDVDAAFYYGDLAHPDVAGARLADVEFRVVGPRAWRARLADADVATLAGQPWILTPPVSTHRALSDRLFGRHGVEPVTVVKADDESVINALVIAGLGISLMRRDAAEVLARRDQVFVWKGEPLSAPLQFIWPRARGDEPAIAALRGLVLDAWGVAADAA